MIAGAAMHLLAHAALPALRLETLVELERKQARNVVFDPEPHISAGSAVAAIRAAHWHEFFAPERKRTRTAVACFYKDSSSVDKHALIRLLIRRGEHNLDRQSAKIAL